LIKNEEFIKIRKVKTTDTSTDILNVAFVDFHEENVVNTNTNNSPEMSMQFNSKEIKINKDYDESVILKEFIDKVIEISEPETYNERVYEHRTVNEIKTDKEIRQLISRMISCGSYIAVNGRIGPAQFVLVPYFYYNNLFSYITDGKLTNMDIMPTNLLSDKIIFGRKNSEDQPGIFLFLDEKRNKYSLTDVGNAKYQYHILKVTSLQDERRKKLEEIENNKN